MRACVHVCVCVRARVVLCGYIASRNTTLCVSTVLRKVMSLKLTHKCISGETQCAERHFYIVLLLFDLFSLKTVVLLNRVPMQDVRRNVCIRPRPAKTGACRVRPRQQHQLLGPRRYERYRRMHRFLLGAYQWVRQWERTSGFDNGNVPVGSTLATT